MNLSVATPLLMQEFGLDAVQMGAIMSVFYVGYGIMNTPGGILADSTSARLTILSRPARLVHLHVDHGRSQHRSPSSC